VIQHSKCRVMGPTVANDAAVAMTGPQSRHNRAPRGQGRRIRRVRDGRHTPGLCIEGAAPSRSERAFNSEDLACRAPANRFRRALNG
jgi:hypothetical protein